MVRHCIAECRCELNLVRRSKPMRQFGLTETVKYVRANYAQVTSTSITKYRMHWAEKLLLKIAAAFVARAMQIRQRRQTFPASLRRSVITGPLAPSKRLEQLHRGGALTGR